MIAEFYIVSESFTENPNLSNVEVETKIKFLAKDFVFIRQYKETNKLFIHPDIYKINFINGVTISDLLNNDEIANKNLDRDTRVFLKRIIWESETTSFTSNEVIENLLSEYDENLCHGLIGFNLVNGVNPDFQVVYDLRGWLEFRRHYLGKYPKNEIFYVDECKKYFPKLFFHERIKETIGTILPDCPKKIVYHLTALNDKFRDSESQPSLNRTEILKHFSINALLDETATLEGNAKRKPAFTFKFMNSKNEEEDVCCEPHLKLCYNDIGSGYSTVRRIYFHEGKSNIHEGKILIGHIGRHL